MSLTDMDMQHLVVLGLSTHSEEDALNKLLNRAECSSPPGFNEHEDWGEFNQEVTTEGSTTRTKGKSSLKQKKKEVNNRQNKTKKEIIEGTKKAQNNCNPVLVSTSSSLKSKNTPLNFLSSSVAFLADKPDVDAESLPPLCDLVHSKLLRPLMECLHVTSFTRIQKLSWVPMIDRTRDVLIRSETGSGKTLAYALPLLHQLLHECDKNPIQRQIGTIIIIVCPTRELVLQVTDVLTVLTRCALFLTVGGIHGGENRHKEKARLRKGIPILITTPGRFLDHLKATASFRVEGTQTIVLDEADRLLDMGFEQTIKDIMRLLLEKIENNEHIRSGTSNTPREKHCLKRVLVSATITAAVERLSHFALRNNVIHVGETEDTFSIPSTLRQHYTLVPTKHRLSTLASFLRSQLDAGAQRIIVFVSTADSAEFHYCLLSRLKSPFMGKKRNASYREAFKKHTHHYSVKKLTEEANRHIHDTSEDVVTFDDDSEDEGETETQGLVETNAFLNVNLFKLHGNMSQIDRASVFKAFKHIDNSTQHSSQKGVLFCTDVAARGLDMPKVDWIVHYDPPTDPKCYVHRIGRTARIGNVGDSVLFLMPHEVGYVSYLSNFTAKEIKSSLVKEGDDSTTVIKERKYESFLFYLTKLDPKANHMWMQSTATLERAISSLVMKRDGDKQGEETGDDLTRLALFAYQSYIRAYSGHSRELKSLFFNSDSLHLGHVAQSFGVDKTPSEVRAQLQGFIREDRKVAREAFSFTTEEGEGARPRRRLRVEVSNDDRYRSMIVQKQRKVTRDRYERKKREDPTHKALQFTEFDA